MSVYDLNLVFSAEEKHFLLRNIKIISQELESEFDTSSSHGGCRNCGQAITVCISATGFQSVVPVPATIPFLES